MKLKIYPSDRAENCTVCSGEIQEQTVQFSARSEGDILSFTGSAHCVPLDFVNYVSSLSTLPTRNVGTLKRLR